MENIFNKRFLKHLNQDIVDKLTTNKDLVYNVPPAIRVACGLTGYDRNGLLDLDEEDTKVGDFMDGCLSGVVESCFEPFMKFNFDNVDHIYYFVTKRACCREIEVTFYAFVEPMN
jgi:hypothetical protein